MAKRNCLIGLKEINKPPKHDLPAIKLNKNLRMKMVVILYKCFIILQSLKLSGILSLTTCHHLQLTNPISFFHL